MTASKMGLEVSFGVTDGTLRRDVPSDVKRQADTRCFRHRLLVARF